jgi:hypothetical protein
MRQFASGISCVAARFGQLTVRSGDEADASSDEIARYWKRVAELVAESNSVDGNVRTTAEKPRETKGT